MYFTLKNNIFDIRNVFLMMTSSLIFTFLLVKINNYHLNFTNLIVDMKHSYSKNKLISVWLAINLLKQTRDRVFDRFVNF